MVWIPLQLAPIVQTSFGLTLVLLAWCLVEIVRYSYYATNLINVNIGILTWLRYTLFIILYPMGVTGEVWCYVDSLAYWKTSKAFSYDMPNTLNFTFQPYVVTLLVILFYLPGKQWLLSESVCNLITHRGLLNFRFSSHVFPHVCSKEEGFEQAKRRVNKRNWFLSFDAFYSKLIIHVQKWEDFFSPMVLNSVYVKLGY